MKKNLILIAVPSGLLAVTALLLLSDASPVRTEHVLGYGSVLALLAVAALDYGFTGRRPLGRN